MSGYNYHCATSDEKPQNLGQGFEDFDTWEKDNYDHATLGYVLGVNDHNNMTPLDFVKLEATKYSQYYNDQWDYRQASFD